jgi:uncharacterized protein YjbI with pentapeptide repeats
METLMAFVRERARWKEPDTSASETVVRFYDDARTDGTKPATDIAAVVSVIRRRSEAGRDLEKGQGWRFDLRATDIRGADLTGASLEGANLDLAHLDGARLWEAHLEGAVLASAHLDGADLTDASLEGAFLAHAHLDGARLWRAHLEGAILYGAYLEGADLTGAHLEGVGYLDKAFGDAKTRLPEGIVRPAHWPPYAGDASA